jgi:SARP family transcriptional regulator, regulator of embCAB operon
VTVSCRGDADAGGKAGAEGIDVSVLGPLEASIAGVSIVPSARKTRRLLALLAVNPDSVVTTARISEELWDDDPPRSATTTLQTYVMQLRNAMAAALAGQADDTATKRLLRRCGTGYLLTVGHGSCDVVDFGRLVSAGTLKAKEGELFEASELLQRALDLWRGGALIDVSRGPVLEAEVVRLEQLRRSALERRIQIDLAIGRHHAAADELSGLALTDLTNESLHGHLMLALHRCGRRADALHAFRRLREAMLDELGLEPSPWLHRLQRAILDADPALDAGDQWGGAGLTDIRVTSVADSVMAAVGG